MTTIPVIKFADALTISPAVAEAAASTRTEAEARAERNANKCADELAWIAKARGDVVLNFYKTSDHGWPHRNPAFPRTMEMFSGPNAEALAREDAADPEDEREPRGDYLNSMIVHPDGTHEFKYLFRL
jgi:hypothetical protein